MDKQQEKSIEVLTRGFYLHSVWNTFVPLCEGRYSSMYLNWQFQIHPGELENYIQCLIRERVTPTTHSTGLQETLAPEMLLNA